MFGFTGTALTNGLIGQNATRTTANDVVTYLNGAKTSLLDVDGNSATVPNPEPLKDGLLILRYMFGFTGDNLIAGLIGTGALRTTATAIQNFLSLVDLNPSTNPVSTLSEATILSTQTSQLAGESTQQQTVMNAPTSDGSASSGSGSSTTSTTPASTSDPSITTSVDGGSSVVLGGQDATFSAESGAVAAFQLSTGTLQSPAWVSGFLGTEEEDELLVTL
jgi:hypothetical protein